MQASHAIPTTWWTSRSPEDAEGASSDFAAALIQQQPQIAQLVQRLLGWPRRGADVDDVVQETLGAAWAHRRTFRGEGPLAAWVARIAVHEARRFHRRHRVWRRLFGGHAPGDVPDPTRDNEIATTVRGSLAQLPHADREMLVLHYLEGQSLTAVARTLGLRENTAHARASRARRKLRALLAAELPAAARPAALRPDAGSVDSEERRDG